MTIYWYYKFCAMDYVYYISLVSYWQGGPKNFVLCLRNPSTGAKLGEHSAAVAYVNSGKCEEKGKGKVYNKCKFLSILHEIGHCLKVSSPNHEYIQLINDEFHYLRCQQLHI